MRRAVLVSCLVSCALLLGCRSYKTVPFKGRIVEVRADAVVVEITSEPGMSVGFGTYLRAGDGKPLPESGKLKLEFKRKVWKQHDGSQIQVTGEKKSLFSRHGGYAYVPLPVPIRSLDEIPDDQDPWFAVLENHGTGADAKKGIELVVAAPGDAELSIAGKTYELDETGITKLTVPMRAVLMEVTTKSMEQHAKATLPVVVKRGKDTTEDKIELVPPSFDADLRPILTAIEDGKTLADKGSQRDLALVVPYNKDIVAIGAAGKVGEASWIAVEHSNTVEGGACVYETFTLTRRYVDVTLDVYEARTGKKVVSKKFQAPTVDCPMFASNKDSLTYRLDFAKVSEWVEGRLKNGWK